MRPLSSLILSNIVRYALLIIGGVICFVPLGWMLSTSLKMPGTEFIFPPNLIPRPVVWSNYIDAVTRPGHPFFLYTRNSVVITFLATLGTVLTSSFVAFGFARIRFRGRDFWFIVLLSTLMLPDVVRLIPSFILFKLLGWIDTLLPLIVPFWFGVNAFYVFLIRQYFRTIPLELDEAALMDGAAYVRIYWQVILPISGPVLGAVTIFSVLSHWNDFLGPLIYTNSVDLRTLALGLRFFMSRTGTDWNQLMAASILMLAPILVLFFSMQRYFIRGIHMTGFGGR
ncbi:MAG: carbohydrate ABC transporter permease [Caldilineaceae bacterium SB0670_bin_27]|uniref:Carbohydrate ABC transporter permease n=1 Tax=Caldilineaceae bacterium SB0664_bin_27 TaxID=2605260 RepID=A0A6B0Z0F1_9CHLR|nr:carbohydrate ABC transporter permease [Caldilineaceae bacterium SB0664_bin_27]MYJ79881.1 carbohydrate ABC transporter permease [Caldilineaceae bacterium SB0670_bin_27]